MKIPGTSWKQNRIQKSKTPIRLWIGPCEWKEVHLFPDCDDKSQPLDPEIPNPFYVKPAGVMYSSRTEQGK